MGLLADVEKEPARSGLLQGDGSLLHQHQSLGALWFQPAPERALLERRLPLPPEAGRRPAGGVEPTINALLRLDVRAARCVSEVQPQAESAAAVKGRPAVCVRAIHRLGSVLVDHVHLQQELSHGAVRIVSLQAQHQRFASLREETGDVECIERRGLLQPSVSEQSGQSRRCTHGVVVASAWANADQPARDEELVLRQQAARMHVSVLSRHVTVYA